MIANIMAILLRALFAVSGIAVLGSLLYYIFPVTWWGLALVTAVAVVLAALAPLPQRVDPPAPRLGVAGWASAGVVAVALAAWWNAVGDVVITDAVRSPWSVVPPFALAALGVAVGGCACLAARGVSRLGLVAWAATLFSALAMAAAVYPLGFGFDPFLHRATVAHIAEYGTITPKPLYYIGEYALELVGTTLLRLPLIGVDRWLLPLFAAFALTSSMALGLQPLLARKTPLALAALMLLPLGAFVSTTPQGIAYVFALSAFALSFARMQGTSVPGYALILLALAAAFTHPFAGIPAVLYVASALTLERLRGRVRTVGLALAGLAAALAIPALFVVQAAHAGLSLNFSPGNIVEPERWHALALTAFASNHFSTAYDGLYLVVDNLLWIVLAFAVIGVVMLLRGRDVDMSREHALLPAVFAGGMLLNFLTLSIVFDFDFLIAYERTDYALRALTMTMLFLLPYAGVAIARIDCGLETKPRVLRAGFLALLALMGMANVYGAYPRHDNYARSAGFNVSAADFDAVYAIDNAAEGEDYIVLANQATSAAAVEAHGFKKYYHTDIFYYPIPTGGPLYTHFLAMVDENPSRATVTAAMDLAGVDLAFFAVSDYWWRASDIVENAKRIADDWFAVGNGAVTVLVFRR